MSGYVKRYWTEPRGDEHDAWGTLWWFFEIDHRGNVARQMEHYQNGRVLKYDQTNSDDEFGGLSTEPLDVNDSSFIPISGREFERLWNGTE